MSKLLATYRANPTLKNAQKVRAYERSHPMSVCVMTDEDVATLANAIHHANRGE